jgi:hypothetical protein
MTDAAVEQARSAVTDLLEADEDQLYEQLGIRAQALASAPQLAGDFAPPVTYDQVAMGPLDAVRDFGKRLFNRWNREAYNLVCADDDADRTELLNAIGVGEAAAAAALAGFIVTNLGIAPAVAAVIAAIVVKRFFRPAYDEFCEVWKEKLPATT